MLSDVVVFEHNTPFVTILFNKCLGLHGDIIVNNAIIFSSRLNPKMSAVIDMCQRESQNTDVKKLDSSLQCLVTTGPVMFTNCIMKLTNVEIFPSYVFEPFSTLDLVRLTDGINDEENVDIIMSFLTKRATTTSRPVGIHMLDLSWSKNGKCDFRFSFYRRYCRFKRFFSNSGWMTS